MKLKLLGTLALSSIILTACGQENVKKTESNPKEEQNKTDNMQTNGSVTNSNSNQKQKTAQKTNFRSRSRTNCLELLH